MTAISASPPIIEERAGKFVVTEDGEPLTFTLKGTGTVVSAFATKEEAQAGVNERLTWRRYFRIVDRLVEHNVCRTCARLAAFAEIEKQFGRTFDWKKERGLCKGIPCRKSYPNDRSVWCFRCAQDLGCVHPRRCEDTINVLAERKKAERRAG